VDIHGYATVGDLLLAEVQALRHRLKEAEEHMGLVAEDEEALADTLEEYGSLREEYDALSGDLAEEYALRTLGELGLPAGLDQPLATTSGGR